MKGVSDLADDDKYDDWQPQAAINAANALYEVMAKYHAFGKMANFNTFCLLNFINKSPSQTLALI